MQVTDVMATQVISVLPDTEIRDAARRMVDAEVGAAVVLDEASELVGVITERDLLRCLGEGITGSVSVSDRMTRHVLTASPGTDIAEALALMVSGHFRHLPVVNDDGHVIGMISMRDLMAYTSLRLRGGTLGGDEGLDPAELLAAIHRMRTGAA
jgi:CBS domain-containing protein